MIEDLRRCVDHGAERIILAVEIGGQDLDHDGGIHLADLGDRASKVLRPAIGNIVAGDGCDDDMLEFHPANGLGDTLGLVLFQRERLGRVDRAESAGSGATVTGNHHGRSAAAPAFPAIRALGTLADSVQAEIRDHRLG